MAASTRTSRPRVVLSTFLIIVAALFVVMGLTKTWQPRLGLDLTGGQTITLTATNPTVDEESMALARDIIQDRIDGLGVGEATVAVQGDREIVVSAPNVSRDDLAQLVGATAQVSFRQVIQQTAGTGPAKAKTDQNGNPLPGLPTALPTAEASGQLLSLKEVLAYQPTEADLKLFNDFVCGDPVNESDTKAIVVCDETGATKYLLSPTAIKGQDIQTASAEIPQGELSYAVALQFNSSATGTFAELTGSLLTQTQPKNLFAIVLDGVVRSAVVPQTKIDTGQAIIRGNFTAQSSAGLANVLKFGALPLSFTPSQVETVSASLGGEQLRVGLIAGAIGIAFVALYSFIYYRGMGVVVLLSLAAAAAATYSTMVLLGTVVGFTLNLPGIAGAIVGIAVTADSFIIYFERIRDEVREGRSLKSAFLTGWQKARGTILISDAVSLLSAVVLFILAVGSVKGFAFTLGLTTLIDLAVVFFFTKPLVELFGRTKFFGEGHKWSGLDAEHMGVSRDSLLGRRFRRRSATTAQEA